jgi:hypothetical protein
MSGYFQYVFFLSKICAKETAIICVEIDEWNFYVRRSFAMREIKSTTTLGKGQCV